LFPYLPKNSTFSNPIGQVSIGLDSPGGTRLHKLIAANTGNIKLLSAVPVDNHSDRRAASHKAFTAMNSEVAHLGLEASAEHCTTIFTAGANGAPSSAPDITKKRPRQLLICDARKRAFPQNEAAERFSIERLFESVRSWCPQLFGSAGSIVERKPDKWSLYFVETDVTLMLYHHQLAASIPLESRSLILGHQDEWLKGTRKLSCAEATVRLRGR
jgi:hypothetical protein